MFREPSVALRGLIDLACGCFVISINRKELTWWDYGRGFSHWGLASITSCSPNAADWLRLTALTRSTRMSALPTRVVVANAALADLVAVPCRAYSCSG